MPVFNVRSPDGQLFRVTAPEGATQDEIIQYAQSQMGQAVPSSSNLSQMSTAQLEAAPSAPTSISDLARSFGIGVVGGVKSLADVFGAGSDTSEYLGEAVSGLQKGLTPARQLEIARRQELERRAAESGDTGKEIKTFLGGVAEAPIQSLLQGVGSSAPTILASLAAIPAGAPATLALGVGVISKAALGAAQNVGELKGSILDAVEAEYVKAGYTEAKAKELAIKAQEYSKDKAVEIGGAALLGALDAFTGIESGVSKAARAAAAKKMAGETVGKTIEGLPQKELTRPSIAGSAVRSALGETPLEGAQGGYGEYATNLALIKEGFLDPEQAMKGVFGAAAREAAVGALTGTAFTPVEQANRMREFNLDQALRQEQDKALAVSEEELAERFPDVLPGGFKINREELGREMAPEGFNIMVEGRDEPLSVVDTQEEADAKLASLTQIREKERANLLKDEEKINADIQKAKARLEQLEATEQTDTDDYKALKAELPTMMDESAQKIKDLYNKSEMLSKPLTVMPFGEVERVNEQFNVIGLYGKPAGTFKTLGEAEASVQQAVGKDVFEQTQQRRETAKELYKTFVPQMRKFGLGDVGLNIVDKIENGAGGAYLDKLIRVSLEEANPIQTMRHESLHAMKDLGFFTPQQWRALEERANKEWIKTYLEGQKTEVDGQEMTRLEGYRKLGYSEQDIIEEAIADAFGAYDKGAKPPPGMIAALFRKMKNFFSNIGQAFRGAGFQSADDIFQNIERGRMKPAEVIAPEAKAAEKLSLKQTTTPEFKSWFGRSEVIDDVGKPKVMYHGLAKDTTDFTRKTARGAPIFLTDDPEFASGFAFDSYDQVAKHAKEYLNDVQIKQGIRKAVAQIKKDYRNDTLGKEMIASIQPGNLDAATPEAKEYLGKAFKDMLPSGPQVMPLYVRAERPFDYENPSHIRKVLSELGEGSYDPAEIRAGSWEAIEGADFQEAIQMAGFDSFYVKEQGRKNLAVYDANQVKSATGNVGTFSRESGDVRLSLPSKSKGEKRETVGPKQPVERPSQRGKLSIQRSGDGGGREEIGRFAPLEDAPAVEGFYGPDPSIVKVAEQYAKDKGIKLKRQARYVDVDPDRARRIADEYEKMEHAPQDPKVKEAYQDLVNQTIDQYRALEKAGYKFWFIDLKRPDNLSYLSSPWNAMRDVRANKTMGIFPTNEGFGSDANFSVDANPLLADTGIKWPVGSPTGPLAPVFANDVFRAVHDVFGHGIEGAGFRARGEENAWQAHAKLFTGPAVGAITSETRGQNSWLNYGPYGDKNKTAKVEDTVFADQKTGLMPEWTWTEGRVEDMPEVEKGIVLGTKQPGAISVKGAHYGNAQVEELNASKYGTGLRGAERRRLDQTFDNRIKKRVYFYIQKEDGTTPPPESGVGQYVYTQKFDNILGPGSEMSRLFSEVRGDSNDFESSVIDAGYDGYAVPSMGMMVILNHNVPVNYVGPRAEVGTVKLSLKGVAFPTAKEAQEAADRTPVPETAAFKRYIAGSQWVDEDGRAKKFFHATTSNFFEFNEGVIYLSDTAEESAKWGKIAEDRLRERVYKALNKDEKLPFFQQAVDEAVAKNKITEAQGKEFMRDAKRAIPEFGKYDSIKKEMDDVLLSLAPDTMKIMPLYARAMTPFDFRNKEHVKQVMDYYDIANVDREVSDATKEMIKKTSGGPSVYVDDILKGLKGILAQGYPSVVERQDIMKTIRRLGFDGYVVRRNRNAPLSYAVFKPEQVKSITGNDGQFSLETKDVRYSLPNLSKDTMDRMKDITPQRYEPGWKERVIGGFKQDYTGLRQKFLNRYEALSVNDRVLRDKIRRAGGPELLADQSGEFAALQSDLSAGVAASAMGIGDRQGGVPIYRNGLTTIDTSVKGLVEALAPLAKQGDPEVYQRYQFWAGWKRGRRLLREGREDVYKPADEKRAREIEAAHPEFVQVQKDLVAFNNGIVKYAVQTGVLSRERAQVYTQYADYIPFYRQLDLDKTIGPNPFGGIAGVKGPKELKGGDAPLGDFLENMVRNTQSMINAGMKNAAAQRATNVALQIGEVTRLPGKAAGLGFDVYTQLENGQLVYYRSADPLFIEALKSLNMPDLPFMGLLSAPANVLRNLVTKDPGFMMANLLRDSLSSYVTSGQKITPIVGTMVNFGKALSSKNKTLQALFNAGAIGGYEFSQNIEQSGQSLSDDLNKKAGKDPMLLRPFKSLWEGLEKGTTASDAATRMAVYERVMAETGNEAEAISRALEVMNFNRKGNSVLIRIATAALPFFNARLQGLDLFYRASAGQMNTTDAQEIKRRFWIRGMTMASLSVMYYLSVADDEEYEKQEEETKDNNWIFTSLGIRIPIPFEVGTLFKTMPERITAYLLGNDTGKELGQSTLRALANTFAFNPIPQTFKPIIEVATNFNFFTMRPIVGQGMQEVAPYLQTGPGTSKTAEAIGEMLNLSPLKVDQLIKGYTGTIGGYVTDVIDSMANEFSDVPKASKRFEQLPVVKRFALDPEARGSVTQFYELQRSVDTVVRTMSLLEKTARPEEYAKYLQDNIGVLAVKDYVRDIEKSMKELRDMRRTINSTSMAADEKRDILIDLGRAENNLTANIKEVKKAVSELK